MIDSSPHHPPNFANHSSAHHAEAPVFSSLSMFRRSSSGRPRSSGAKNRVAFFLSVFQTRRSQPPCPARIQPRICCSAPVSGCFILFSILSLHPSSAASVYVMRSSGFMACEPALRLGTGVVSACGAPEDGGLVLFVGWWKMGIQKAPSRFDLTLLCDSFSC